MINEAVRCDCLRSKFARSINLERDSSEMAVLNNYQVTAKAQEVIERFVAALGDERYLHGPWSDHTAWGNRRSSISCYATTGSNTCSLTQTALDKLKSANEDLYDRFTGRKNQVTSQTGFFRIPM